MANSRIRVLVAGNIPRWLTIVRNVSGFVVPLSALLFFVNRWLGSILCAIGFTVFIVLQIVIVVRRRKQRWVTDTGDGFIIEDRAGRREYEDEDIYALHIEAPKVYWQGELKGVRRIFRIKVQDEPAEIEMRNFIAVGQADRLGPLIARNVEHYRLRASEALGAGAVLSGSNWSLTASELTVQGKSPTVLPLDGIGSVAVFDRHVCLWKRGEHEACLRIPVRSKNAFLLQLVLAHRISEQGDVHPEQEDGLGRILFQRRGSQIATVILYILALVLGLVGVGAGIEGARTSDIGLIILSGLMFVLTALCIWGIRVNRRSVLRCHERGVYQRRAFSELQLRYEEVDEFTYSATRQYYNGAYVGTALSIVFTSCRDKKRKMIRFSRSVKNADEELDELSGHVARVMSWRLLEKLANGQRAEWTDKLALLPEGIEYRPDSFVGRKPPVVLPYNAVQSFQIDKGVFHLWELGHTKSIINQPVWVKNFLPGYHALVALFQPDPATAASGAQPGKDV